MSAHNCPVFQKEMKLFNGDSSQIVQLAKKFNNFYLKYLKTSKEDLCELKLGSNTIGLINSKSTLCELKKHPSVFLVKENFVLINPNLKNYKERSKAIADVAEFWRKNDTFVTLRGWRNECFEIKKSLSEKNEDVESSEALFEMERSATCILGMRQFGVDINGYVNHPQKGLCLWMQKRADDKQTWPGMMDNMVGGGLSVGYSIRETALKEACEEAGIPQDLLATNLRPAGSVSFYFESERGLFPNTEFVFDLELPIDFLPKNQDGEVQEFLLLTVKEVVELVLSPTFKTTSCPVTLDFLLRHGVIHRDNEPHLSTLEQLLHIPLHSIYH